MDFHVYQHQSKQGWSAPHRPDLDSENTLLLLFAGQDADLEQIDVLRGVYRNAKAIGCSTSGEIFNRVLDDRSIVAAVVRFEATRVARASVQVADVSMSYEAARSLAAALRADNLAGVIVLSDGLHVNGSDVTRGLNAELPPNVVVTGGLAGDGKRFERTWVLDDHGPAQRLLSGIGLYGPHVRIGHGSRGGWDPFGPERLVTRSEGNVLYELDGKPALPLYKEYLGERASGLPSTALLFPLTLRTSESSETILVRTILGIDEKENSLIFAGDVPQGALARLMRANLDRLINGAAESAVLARDTGVPDAPCLSIAVSCVGRRLVLGERTEEELESVLDTLPAGSQQIGFYSYGEISPYATGHCDLHNQTMTLTTLAEVL